jgi:hypothetical protein
VRSHGESRIGQLAQQLPIMAIEKNVVYLVAFLTDKMLVFGYEGIEVLRTTEGQDLQLAVAHKLLQISVDGSQTDTGQPPPNFEKDLIRGRVGSFVFDGFPYDFQLPGISLLLLQVRCGKRALQASIARSPAPAMRREVARWF